MRRRCVLGQRLRRCCRDVPAFAPLDQAFLLAVECPQRSCRRNQTGTRMSLFSVRAQAFPRQGRRRPNESFGSSATGSERDATSGHKSIMCGSVQTGKKVCMYTDILAASNLPLKGNSYHGRYNQDGPCHRVCRRSLAVAAIRWRNNDRDNDEWRDDGERKHGRNQLDVASYLACRHIRYRAFLGHIRKKVRQAAGPPKVTTM